MKIIGRRTLVGCLVVMGGAIAATSARADLYGFYNLSNNNATNAANGESQLAVDVTDAGSNQVLFHFTNTGAIAMSITDVYFDNGSALGSLSAISNGAGVAFSNGASPGNLPSGNTATPPFVADFAMDSDAPAQPNGVNPGETLGIIFNLAGGYSFSDLIDELNSAATRIGIHVQGFANGGSEAFINTPNTNVVPAPPAVLLGALGLGFVRLAKRSLAKQSD